MITRAASLLLLLALAPIAAAQIPGLGKTDPAAPPSAPVDPLGRSTARGAIVGVSRAVDRGDLTTAALYLQLRGPQQADAQSLAQSLNGLIDRELREGLGHMS